MIKERFSVTVSLPESGAKTYTTCRVEDVTPCPKLIQVWGRKTEQVGTAGSPPWRAVCLAGWCSGLKKTLHLYLGIKALEMIEAILSLDFTGTHLLSEIS